jgi:N-acetylmuramoyl-L-alanine amidase
LIAQKLWVALFVVFSCLSAYADIPCVRCFEISEGTQCLVVLDKPLPSSLKVRRQKSFLSLVIQQENSGISPLSLFRPVPVSATVTGYELHRTPETLCLRFNTKKPLHVSKVSLIPKDGKFLLQFLLIPHALSKRPSFSVSPLIVIDPGHGGVDPGARGSVGPWEKEITLRMAYILKKGLIQKGYRALLTRTKDETLRRVDRLKKGEKAEADLFISLHADHNPIPKMRGISIYTLAAEASDAESAYLAQRENAAEEPGQTSESQEVAHILQDLCVRDIHRKSERFARLFAQVVEPRDRLVNKMHRSASFLILQSLTVPSVLIELGYLSNPEDRQRLSSDVFLHKVSRYIVRAIDLFWKSNDL